MSQRAGGESRTIRSVIGAPIDSLGWETALSRLANWAAGRQSRYICICNVHSVVTARQDTSFAKVIREADMATPDGAPVAWLMRKLGAAGQARINGPDLMWRYCAEAAGRDESIYLYGGQQTTLDLLQTRLLQEFPGLKIVGAYSPPYRALTPEEDEAVVEVINASGAGTVWVSLGCPKQEQWMADHRGRVKATMIGVGAAFDYHAGTIQRAPLWMQQNGLEWLHRVCSEPRRLWRRYLVTNTLFIVHAAQQLLTQRAPNEVFIDTPKAEASGNHKSVAAGLSQPSHRVMQIATAIAEQANRLLLEAALVTGSKGEMDLRLHDDLAKLVELTSEQPGRSSGTPLEANVIHEITQVIGRISATLETASEPPVSTATQRDNVLVFPLPVVRASRELTRLSTELNDALVTKNS